MRILLISLLVFIAGLSALKAQHYLIQAEIEPMVLQATTGFVYTSRDGGNLNLYLPRVVSQQGGIRIARQHKHLVLGVGMYAYTDRQKIVFDISTGYTSEYTFVRERKELDFFRHYLGAGVVVGHNTGKWSFEVRFAKFKAVAQNEIYPSYTVGMGRFSTSGPQNSIGLQTTEQWSDGAYRANQQLSIGYQINDRLNIGLTLTQNRIESQYYSLSVTELQILDGVKKQHQTVSFKVVEANRYLGMRLAYAWEMKRKTSTEISEP